MLMKRDIVVCVLAGAAFVAGVIADEPVCQRAVFEYGLDLPVCPSGKVRQTARLEVSELRRGAQGAVILSALAHYTTADADAVQLVPVRSIHSIALSLVAADGIERPLPPARAWKVEGDGMRAPIALPEVPDGDYKLRARFKTPLGHGELDVDVPLYTPARVHVITDRPLYEPGNVVQFRAVVLRARDLTPIDGRPGKWVVRDASGETVLDEQAAAGDWGVVAGTFPLDKGAPTGAWSVAWESAGASDAAVFTVEPFTLPRFRVDAAAPRAFYLPGDRPEIKGSVVYSSGAPVARAALDIDWHVGGDWPVPREWQESVLPRQAVAGANGRFELALPEVPADLQGRVMLVATISAIDPAGDRVATAVPVLLSEEGIVVSAVTELDDGLVEGFNNRVYLRVTTPDERVVPNAKITVKRAWQPSDNGIDAMLDEDGVASLQLDPGAPVNVVIPARPHRPPPRPPLVKRIAVEELIAGDGASLEDQLELDRWLPALAPCAKWVGIGSLADSDEESDGDSGDAEVRVGLRVGAGGAILAAAAGSSPLARCALDVIRGRRLPAGSERMYTLHFAFTDPDLPRVTTTVESTLDQPGGLAERVAALAASARDCIPATGSEGALAQALTWSARAGSTEVELGGWIDDPNGGGRGALACVQSRVRGRVVLPDKVASASFGLVRFSVALPERLEQERPQPTAMLGYELLVTADIEGAPVAKLRVPPRDVPHLRMRVTPILARPGDVITAELIRGPSFSGKLPKELELRHFKGTPITAKLDDERKASFVIANDTEGWVEITGAGLRSLVYVRPSSELSVQVTPGRERYAPGQLAELAIATTLSGAPGPAAVTLIGVDQSLGQLVPLPGPDALRRVQPRVGTSSPAFGTLDGQALALGRIRGANAAAATVLRVTTIPEPPELDAVVHAVAYSELDPIAELTDRFYIVLAELHEQARQWEASAPPAEQMRPRTMAGLWKQALAAVSKRGHAIDDAYGRTLTLSRLPEDLLALVDPRAVIVSGTRLPEDVENWSAWVRKEKP
jgi:hypothetical protein